MTLLFCVAALLLIPQAAFAQGNPGPFGGLFGRTPERQAADVTVFELRGSAGTHWDGALIPAPEGAGESRYGGTIGTVAGAALFLRRTDRTQFTMQSSADYRQTVDTPSVGGTTISNDIRFGARPTTRFSFDVGASHIHTPFFRFHPSFVTLESGRVVPGLPYVATLLSNQTVSALAGLSYQYSKHGNFSLSATRRESMFPDHPAHDVRMDGVQALLGRNISRNVRLKFGFGRERWFEASSRAPHVQEEIEAGVDFARGLSLGRRTTFNFSTSSTLVSR